MGIIAFYIFYSNRTKEPIYKGKSVSVWASEGAANFRRQLSVTNMADLNDLINILATIPAYAAIKEMGANAIPHLIRILNIKPVKWKSRAYRDIYHSKYLPQFIRSKLPIPVTSDIASLKMFAAYTLISMNMSSYEQQTALFETLIKNGDPEMRSVALAILMNNTFTNEQIEKLIDKYYWESHDCKAILYLNDQLDFKGTNLVKYFVPLLTNTGAGLRQKTVGTLIKLGPSALPALPNLMITATNDPDKTIRILAVRAIGAIGPTAREAMPFLLTLTNSEQSRLAIESRNALHAIVPELYP
jgi:hypothetical protein